MKPEQRATRDENHALEMPRQGVSFLNDMLDCDFCKFTKRKLRCGPKVSGGKPRDDFVACRYNCVVSPSCSFWHDDILTP